MLLTESSKLRYLVGWNQERGPQMTMTDLDRLRFITRCRLSSHTAFTGDFGSGTRCICGEMDTLGHVRRGCYLYTDILPDNYETYNSVERSEAVYRAVLERKAELVRDRRAEQGAGGWKDYVTCSLSIQAGLALQHTSCLAQHHPTQPHCGRARHFRSSGPPRPSRWQNYCTMSRVVPFPALIRLLLPLSHLQAAAAAAGDPGAALKTLHTGRVNCEQKRLACYYYYQGLKLH